MYLQIGAMLGTMMAANVLFVIIPAQRKLVDAKEQGRAPDPIHGLRGKQRSVHNNYFTLPVLLTMISNHYPMTFGHPHAWLVLVCLLLLAAYVRHFFNLRHRGRTVWAIPVTAAARRAGAGHRHRAAAANGAARTWRSRDVQADHRRTLLDVPCGAAATGRHRRRAEGDHARNARADRRECRGRSGSRASRHVRCRSAT